MWAANPGVVGVIRRPAHGATRRPPFERPGSGFGRPLRPRPPARWRDVELLGKVREWDPSELLVSGAPEPANGPTPVSHGDGATVIHLT
jgi:hypothetical protein